MTAKNSRRDGGGRKQGPQDGGTSVEAGAGRLAPVIPIRRSPFGPVLKLGDVIQLVPLVGWAEDNPGDER